MGLSIISGPVFDRGYFRLLITVGSFLTVFGVMMTSLATEYYQIILAQGVCVGLGGGFLFVTSVAIVSTYFDTKRALAVGVMASGGSIGSLLYPIIFRQLEPKIGFAWTTRVIGFIALGTLLVAAVLMRTRLPPPKKARPMVDFTAVKNIPYTIFSIGLFVCFAGLYIPIFYIVSYAQSKGIGIDMSVYLLSILNAGSVFGRVIPGLIADRYGALETIIVCTMISALLGYAWLAVQSLAGLVVISVIYGFTSGAVVSLQATVVASLVPEVHMIGTWMGMSLFMGGIGILIGSPISGVIADSSAGFSGALIFAASFTVAGGALFILTYVLRPKRDIS